MGSQKRSESTLFLARNSQDIDIGENINTKGDTPKYSGARISTKNAAELLHTLSMSQAVAYLPNPEVGQCISSEDMLIPC